jgi:hypothetical protein
MIDMTVGCDPEVFLRESGKIISSIGKIGGSKSSPKQITKNTWVQEDNVTVEFNISPVKYTSPGCLYKAASAGLKDVKDYLKDLNKNFDVEISPEGYFGEELYHSPEAWVFGCDPDLNAYEFGGPNKIPNMQDTVRFAGGHIHIGYDESKVDIPKWALVIMADMAVLSKTTQNKVSLCGSYRGQFYGMPGSYRDKPYGFEYRTPSNVWLLDQHKFIAETVCSTVHWAINNVSQAEKFYAALNTRILDKVRQLCEKNFHIYNDARHDKQYVVGKWARLESQYAIPELKEICDEHIKL